MRPFPRGAGHLREVERPPPGPRHCGKLPRMDRRNAFLTKLFFVENQGLAEKIQEFRKFFLAMGRKLVSFAYRQRAANINQQKQ